MRKNILFTIIVLGVLLVVAQILFIEFHTPIPALKSGDMVALSRLIARGEDHVKAEDLAQWIVEGRKDFTLIDVRPTEEFQAGHIQTARHIAIPDLLQNGTIDQLPSDRSIVLYSNGTANAAQAVVVLRCSGIKAYSLMGGYNHWQEFTQNPETAGNADEETLQTVKRKATGWYFSEDYDAMGGMPLGKAAALPVSAGPTPDASVTGGSPPHRLGAFGQESAAPQTVPLSSPAPDAEPAEAEEEEEAGLIVEEGC